MIKPSQPFVSNQMWGGRFDAAPAEIMQKINASIDTDKRLASQDIAGSRAHCKMLIKQGILSPSDGEAILEGLARIEQEIAEGRFAFSLALEDIHMHIEARLAELIGPAAGRLHTARSRNDQVATDFKLWVREAIDQLDVGIRSLMLALAQQAETHCETIMPGFTHLQIAQPVTLGHHLMAYAEMLSRDRSRLRDARRRLNECPLGAAALAGTSFPIDRTYTAQLLNFDRPTRNSLDSVADRDFALEYLAGGAILAMHLSRLAEELVLWMSDGFRYIRLSDAFTTGSSIMPQKRNPDAAELIRAKLGVVYGAFSTLLMVMKGLPLTYSKDMQEDKLPVFTAHDALSLSLGAMTGMIRDMQVNRERLLEAAGRGYSTATDLADWLVREAGLPFRDAHHIVGAVVKRAEQQGCRLPDLPLSELQEISPAMTADARAVLDVEASVRSRTSYGGTAPNETRKALAALRQEIEE